MVLTGAVLGLLWRVDACPAASPWTGAFPRLEVSARGLALGGTPAAAAEGSESVLWNPAGLLSLERRELTFTYADLFGLGLVDHSVVQFGWPFLRTRIRWDGDHFVKERLPAPAHHAIGIAFSSVRAEVGEEDSYSESQLALALAWRMFWGLRSGLTYRYLTADADVGSAGGHGHGVDFGMLREVGPVDLGFSATNLVSSMTFDPEPESDGVEVPDRNDPIPRRWEAGLAFRPLAGRPFGWEGGENLRWFAGALWSGDGFETSQYSTGGEFAVLPECTVRGAARRRHDVLGWRWEWGAGLGVRVGELRFDYGVTDSAHDLGTTHRWGAGIAL